MAKQTSSTDSSLPLHEVLEAEFVALHGELPQNYPSSGEPETRLKALWAAVHGLKEKRTALCISGGGIRSATFGLGILQGLARCGLLDKFHYLSTVSGGGYIGSWLSAWTRNDPDGIRGVVEGLKHRPDSAINPEPQPIRHLREFSNYLAPRTGLTSVDFWTLITTFIRNMFLNWLVLISWLAAAMMIPRLYLAAINLQPDWSGQATWYLWKLSADKLQPNWDAFWSHIKQPWDTGLTLLLLVGFGLIAVAMAYAIIDVPSTGNARLSQRRFLIFRQLPLLLASLLLAAWWAVFRNVHGSDLFQPRQLLPWFVGFTVASYVSGGLLGVAILRLRKPKKKKRPRPFVPSLARLFAILVTTVLAGFCLWAFATRMFLDPKKIEFTHECDAIRIPSGEKITIPAGTEATIKEVVDASYVIQTDQGPARVAERGLDVLERDPETNLAKKFRSKRDCEAILIPSGRKTDIPAGTEGSIMETADEGSYVLETDHTQVRIAKKDVNALRPKESKFNLTRACNATTVPDGNKTTLPAGKGGVIKQIDDTEYTIETGEGKQACIARKHLDAFDLKPAPAPAKHAVTYVSFAPILILVVFLLVNFLFTGLSSWVTDDEDREWWGRSGAWILITIFGWIAINLVVLWGGQAISPTGNNQLAVFLGQVQANPAAKAILGTFGGVTGVAGALLALRSKLSGTLGQKAGFQWILVGVAVVFLVLLAVVISWALVLIGSQPWTQHVTAWLLGGKQNEITDPNSWRVQLFVIFILTLVILLFGVVMGFFINANRFSLHATYRNRLIRAYLAASRATRSPNRFTGFDPDDNFELHKLPAGRPLHLLNGALNLVRGEQLAWQERKAESFTMSRLHCGSWNKRVGYRPSAEYGDGITLGTAMAISGAAANPNMGYHSSPVVGFLMALFNVRLGWWLGNPGAPGAKTWRLAGPRYSVGPLFSEAAGNTTDHYKYVNLSDGGHFENLGLYEMVLRRCHFIVVSDGGEDPECAFADLGEAVRKIRIDFGIPIEFGTMTIYPRSAIDTLKTPGHNCALGRIRYSVVDGDDAPDGVIIYIKPACYGDEPRDIYEYFKTNLAFPHESTSDQFFSESQFESYRMLGAYTMEKFCTDCHGDFRCFISDILGRHLEMEAPSWLAALLGAPVATSLESV
jgi:Patatin-like phospholipase